MTVGQIQSMAAIGPGEFLANQLTSLIVGSVCSPLIQKHDLVLVVKTASYNSTYLGILHKDGPPLWEYYWEFNLGNETFGPGWQWAESDYPDANFSLEEVMITIIMTLTSKLRAL